MRFYFLIPVLNKLRNYINRVLLKTKLKMTCRKKIIKSSELFSFWSLKLVAKKKVWNVQLYFPFNPKTAKNENCTSLGSSNSISQLPVRYVIRIDVWMWDIIKWIFKLLQDKRWNLGALWIWLNCRQNTTATF